MSDNKQQNAGAVDATESASAPKMTEKEYADALARMNKLKDQIVTLRIEIPYLFANFGDQHQTPAALFQSFEESALRLSKQLAELKENWKDEHNVKLFEHARKSREESSDYDSVPGLERDDPPFDFAELDFDLNSFIDMIMPGGTS